MSQKRVLSGIRASGRLHLGNYLGAVKGMLALQDLPAQAGDPNYETFYMVADLHSITTPYDPNSFQKAVREVVLDYLSAGIDPQKSTLFVQSHVPEHVELAYLLSSVVSIARMSHLPTYKEKVKQYPDNVNLALLNYPVLMAADILAYKADLVPVGDDQLPHLEVTREIARKMNERYSLNFPEPTQFKTEGHYVPSLMGEGKMSKTVEGSYINLTDSLETIKVRLAAAPTDSGKGVKVSEEGGVANLLKLVEIIEGVAKRQKYEEQYKGEGIKYAELKENLAGAIYETLKPIQEKRKFYEEKPDEVDIIITEGAKKAQTIAKATLAQVKKAMGLI